MRIGELVEHLNKISTLYGDLIVTIGTDMHTISTAEVSNIDILNKHTVYLRDDEGLRWCSECRRMRKTKLYAHADSIHDYVCKECVDKKKGQYKDLIPVIFYI